MDVYIGTCIIPGLLAGFAGFGVAAITPTVLQPRRPGTGLSVSAERAGGTETGTEAGRFDPGNRERGGFR